MARLPPVPDESPRRSWGSLRAELEEDVRRVSDRLRSLSATRLAGAPTSPAVDGPGHVSRAAAGRAAAAELAAAALALELVAGQGPPHPPQLPTLSDFAVGDQVAVTGHDLLAAMDLVSPDAVAATATGTAPAADVVRHAAAVLADVRRGL